jgi:hypothetical protein
MTPQEKAQELLRAYNNYTSSWTTTSKPYEPPEAIYEVGMKKGRAKQCALIAVDEILNHHLQDEGLYRIDKYFWEQVKIELKNI